MRIPLKAWYYRSTIPEKKVREIFKEYEFESQDPIVIRVDKDKRVMITGYGAIVFWPYDEQVASMVSSRLNSILDDPSVVDDVEDRVAIEIEAPKDEILFDSIQFSHEHSDQVHMRLAALLLAQSVAFDYLELEVDEALEKFSGTMTRLRDKGNLHVSKRRVMKTIGFAMHTRHQVLSNLALFDKPPEVWEDEALHKLYGGLTDYFDLPERHENLSTKLDFLSENTSLMFDVLTAKTGHRLEWTIIILIAIEIVAFFLYELLG